MNKETFILRLKMIGYKIEGKSRTGKRVFLLSPRARVIISTPKKRSRVDIALFDKKDRVEEVILNLSLDDASLILSLRHNITR